MQGSPVSVADELDLRLPPRADHARTARLAVGTWLEASTTLSEEVVQRVRLAVTEIFANAVGAQMDQGADAPVGIRVEREPGAVRVQVVDAGGGFPTDPEPPDGSSLGVGLQLARAMVDDLSIDPVPGGTRVTMLVHDPEAS